MTVAMQDKIRWMHILWDHLKESFNADEKEAQSQATLICDELVQGFSCIISELNKQYPQIRAELYEWALQNDNLFKLELSKAEKNIHIFEKLIPQKFIDAFFSVAQESKGFRFLNLLYPSHPTMLGSSDFPSRQSLACVAAFFYAALFVGMDVSAMRKLLLDQSTSNSLLRISSAFSSIIQETAVREVKPSLELEYNGSEVQNLLTNLHDEILRVNEKWDIYKQEKQTTLICDELFLGFYALIHKFSTLYPQAAHEFYIWIIGNKEISQTIFPKKFIDYFYSVAQALYDAQKYLKADKVFRLLTILFPLNPVGWKGLGSCQKMRHLPELSMISFAIADTITQDCGPEQATITFEKTCNSRNEINLLNFFEIETQTIFANKHTSIPLMQFLKKTSGAANLFYSALSAGVHFHMMNRRLQNQIAADHLFHTACKLSSILEKNLSSQGIRKDMYTYIHQEDVIRNQQEWIPIYGSTTSSYQEMNREDINIRASHFLSKDIVGKSILEFGCNQGGVLFACRNLGASEITGMDLNPWCIDQAKALVAEQKIEKAHFYVGDIENRALLSTLPMADTVFLLAVLDTSEFVNKTAVIANISRFAKHALYYEGHETNDSHVPRMYEFFMATDFTRFEYLGRHEGRVFMRCSRELMDESSLPVDAITSDAEEEDLLNAEEIYLFTDSPCNPPFSTKCKLIQFVQRTL